MEYKGFYISYISDNEDNNNLGGYYCQVYVNGFSGTEIDNFYIYKQDIDKYKSEDQHSLLCKEEFIINNLIVTYIDNEFYNLKKLKEKVQKGEMENEN